MGYSSDNSGGGTILKATIPHLIVAAADTPIKVKNGADFICTGTNDQNTINSAIQSLPTTGGSIVLCSGNFSISAPIVIDRGLDFRGQGQSTYITLANNINTSMIQFNYPSNNKQQHSRLGDMILFGNKTGNTGAMTCAIDLQPTGTTDYPRDLTIENIWVDSFNGDGLGATSGLNGAHHALVSHCSFENMVRHGISFTVGTIEITIFDGLFYANGQRGISYGSPDGLLKVANCHFENNLFDAVYLYNNDLITYPKAFLSITGNKFHNNGTSGSGQFYNAIKLLCKGAQVIGNTITSTSSCKYAIEEVSPGNYNNISNNMSKIVGTQSGNYSITGANSINVNNITI